MSVIYRLISRMALPLARVYLLKRSRKQPAYRDHWDERFGQCTYPAPKGRRIWLHAVSVGETMASRSLIDALLREYPDHRILLTCMTPTGRDVGAKLVEKYAGRIEQCYLPYDTPELMGKFLDETRPEIGLLMETEVWPNLLDEAKKRGIPMVLANARESEKSRRQAARFDSIMRPAFAAFSMVLAQSEDDRARLESLGATNIHVCGSVKFDLKPDERQQNLARELKSRLNRPVVLLASTRQGEEMPLIEAIDELADNVLVWLVPRHPQRFDEVEACLKNAAVSYLRKTQVESLDAITPQVRVLLADTMGEMSFNCAMGDVCVMGGSLGNFGCQNLIEPAAAGVPVIVGPSSFNFAKPVDDAVAMGAATRVADAREAMQVAQRWLEDGELVNRSRCAKMFSESYTGATEKMMQRIRLVCKK